MPEHKNDSFRNMNIKEKMATILGIALLIILAVGFVFGLFSLAWREYLNYLMYDMNPSGHWLFSLSTSLF